MQQILQISGKVAGNRYVKLCHMPLAGEISQHKYIFTLLIISVFQTGEMILGLHHWEDLVFISLGVAGEQYLLRCVEELFILA